MNTTPEPITPLDIECPTCAVGPRTFCIAPKLFSVSGYTHRQVPHNARVEAARRANLERRRKERAR